VVAQDDRDAFTGPMAAGVELGRVDLIGVLHVEDHRVRSGVLLALVVGDARFRDGEVEACCGEPLRLLGRVLLRDGQAESVRDPHVRGRQRDIVVERHRPVRPRERIQVVDLDGGVAACTARADRRLDESGDLRPFGLRGRVEQIFVRPVRVGDELPADPHQQVGMIPNELLRHAGLGLEPVDVADVVAETGRSIRRVAFDDRDVGRRIVSPAELIIEARAGRWQSDSGRRGRKIRGTVVCAATADREEDGESDAQSAAPAGADPHPLSLPPGGYPNLPLPTIPTLPRGTGSVATCKIPAILDTTRT
jgi:hypothetical protein